MSGDRYAFDTNILVYALDNRDERKHLIARALIGQADAERCVVPLQTLGELCNTASKKQPYLLAEAERLSLALPNLFQVVPASRDDFALAFYAHRTHHLQFWDAMLWAAVQRTECRLLLSEDFQDGRTLGVVTFRNPFTLTQTEIEALLT